MALRNACEDRVDVVGPFGTHGAVEKKLFEHILLRVAAAEAIHTR
jgi:hypothetical protein